MHQATFLVIIISLLSGVQSKTTARPSSPSTDSHPVHEVLSIVPVDKIHEIERAHLDNDEGFKAAVLYLQGPEWRVLVDSVLASPEYKKFAEMSAKYKMNISQAISCLKNHIQSLKVDSVNNTAKPNLESFVADVQKVIPFGEITKLLAKKATDDPELKKMRQEIGSKENQKIAENLHNLREMVKLREILKGMNFDVEPHIALVYAFLGWVH